MMDLLERYLAAVRRNLPAREAEDIIAELRDVLLATAEERQERTGSADWTKLLREFGHPLVVAARYRKQQWLIGPEIYPFYVNLLKVIVGVAVAAATGVALLKAVLWADSAGHAITGWLSAMWWAAASAVGSVTIIFVVIERFSRRSIEQCTSWNPDALPEPVDRQPSLFNSMFEVGFGALFLLWWLGAIPTPQFAGAKFRIEAAPVWAEYFWPIAALLALRLLYNLVVWLRPRWKSLRWTLGALTATGALATAAAVYRSGEWLRVVPTSIAPADAAGLQSALNLALRIAIVVVVIVWMLGIAGELWRLVRSLRQRPLAPGGTAALGGADPA